ncbi:MAG: hypothetical protein CME64_07615 [Halobacteriovoraceae bacterium]|nr:hypothetical protein [Halobacteriovoraceae bacterium]|tara:strand:- start:68339 stop:69022 length:684 start_codon:yes stop_codon:yes gene_type:complete
MKKTLLILIPFILLSCGDSSDDSDTDSTPSNESPTERTETESETEGPREVIDPEQLVISSLMTELKMGLETTDSRVGEAMGFVNSEVCESLQTYMDNFGIGNCEHSCEEEKFVRSCEGQEYATSCQGETYNLKYTSHQMSWDLSTLGDAGEGISNYKIKAAGTVSRNNEASVNFDCDMSIKGRRDRTFSIISCGQSLELQCNIMGKDYSCKELLKYVVRKKECAKSR